MSDELIIDGVTMPTLKLNGLTISKANAEMIGDILAVKYTLKCTWPPLSREQAAIVDKAVAPAFFNVTFTDPGSNSQVTKRFYAGTPTYSVYTYVKGVKTYQGVGVDLIEK